MLFLLVLSWESTGGLRIKRKIPLRKREGMVPASCWFHTNLVSKGGQQASFGGLPSNHRGSLFPCILSISRPSAAAKRTNRNRDRRKKTNKIAAAAKSPLFPQQIWPSNITSFTRSAASTRTRRQRRSGLPVESSTTRSICSNLQVASATACSRLGSPFLSYLSSAKT